MPIYVFIFSRKQFLKITVFILELLAVILSLIENQYTFRGSLSVLPRIFWHHFYYLSIVVRGQFY